MRPRRECVLARRSMMAADRRGILIQPNRSRAITATAPTAMRWRKDRKTTSIAALSQLLASSARLLSGYSPRVIEVAGRCRKGSELRGRRIFRQHRAHPPLARPNLQKASPKLPPCHSPAVPTVFLREPPSDAVGRRALSLTVVEIAACGRACAA